MAWAVEARAWACVQGAAAVAAVAVAAAVVAVVSPCTYPYHTAHICTIYLIM